METGIYIPKISTKNLKKIAGAIEFGNSEGAIIPFLERVKEKGYSLFSAKLNFRDNALNSNNPFFDIDSIIPYLGNLGWLETAILVEKEWGEENKFIAPENKLLFVHPSVWYIRAEEIKKLQVLGIDIQHTNLGKELVDKIKWVYNQFLDTKNIDIKKNISENRNCYGLKWHYGIDIIIETEKNVRFKSGKLMLESFDNQHDGEYSSTIGLSGKWIKEPSVSINPHITFEDNRLKIKFDDSLEKKLKKVKRRNLEKEIGFWKATSEILPEQIRYYIKAFDKIVYERQGKNGKGTN